MFNKILKSVFFILLLPSLLSASPLVRIIPKGEEINLNQSIRLEFDRPMVALGQSEFKDDTISIKPELKGSWRWVDPHTLSFKFESGASLKAASKYEIEIKEGINALDGTRVKPLKSEFFTIRPKVNYTFFKYWEDIYTPVFEFYTNLPVSQASLLKNLSFQTKTNTYPVKLEKVYQNEKNLEFASRWLVYPAGPLPLDSEIDLIVQAGILSNAGPLKSSKTFRLSNFASFPEPAFLGVRYVNKKDNKQFSPSFTEGRLTKERRLPANPEAYTELVFSVPLKAKEAGRYINFSPSISEKENPWENYYSENRNRILHQKGKTYSLSLPFSLLPMQQYHISIDAELSDFFGRKIREGAMAYLETDHLEPSFYLNENTLVLEKESSFDLPLSLTNIDSFTIKGEKSDASGYSKIEKKDIPGNPEKDTQIELLSGVRDLIQNSGIIKGEILSKPEAKSWEGAEFFTAIVSPWQIMVKIGHFNSLVWVVDLSSGEPVSGVKISIKENDKDGLDFKREVISAVSTDKDGMAILPGTLDMDPEQKVSQYKEKDKLFWYLEASLEDDYVLFPLDWQFALNTWYLGSSGVYTIQEAPLGHIRSWGLSAQGIYRVGETIKWKLYVRNQDSTGLIPPPLSGWTLKILNPRYEEVFLSEDIKLSEFGTLDGSYEVPEDASVGFYHFQLSHKDSEKIFSPLSVMVTDFSTAPFRVKSEIRAEKAKPGEELFLKASASLHSGGAYANADLRMRSRLQAQDFIPSDPKLRNFYFNTRSQDNYLNTLSINDLARKLDGNGELSLPIKLPETDMAYGRLIFEALVNDERGKSISSLTSVPFAGRDLLVGIKSRKWVEEAGKLAEFDLVVVDEDSKLISDVPIRFIAEKREVFLVRAKGPDNSYIPRYESRWQEVASSFVNSSDKAVEAIFSPNEAGLWRVSAEIKDRAGRVHKSHLSVWVSGKGNVLWEDEDDIRLELFPEKNTYNAGETASIFIKNPFPGAKALITVERYGIIKHMVKTLERSAELIEIPIESSFIPEAYISVSILSPRIKNKTVEEKGPDLGKPAFRTGYAKLSIKASEEKNIPVYLKLEKEDYKPGEEVNLDIFLPENFKDKSEICLAVLDSAIFDLLPEGRKHYNPYSGLYTPVDSIDIQNYALLSRLFTPRSLSAKGGNPAGDGGDDLYLRENFLGVAYWNPLILPDENGRARVSFKAPDNLTSWEVFAMLIDGKDKTGTGHALFRVNRPSEIQTAMPNFLRVKDKLDAAFSIYNRTGSQRQLDIDLKFKQEDRVLKEEKFKADFAPWERRFFTSPIEVSSEGVMQMQVQAKDDLDGDALVHKIEIEAEKDFANVLSISGFMEEEKKSIAIKIPETAKNDTGGMGIRLSPSQISAIEEPLLFFRDYPYECWEQELSKAMAAVIYLSMMNYLPDELSWPDAETLPETILAKASRYQKENGCMLYYPSSEAFESPFLSAYTAFIFAKLEDFGFKADKKVISRLDSYLEELTRKELVNSQILNRNARFMLLAAKSRQFANYELEDKKIFQDLKPDPLRDNAFSIALYLKAAAEADLSYKEIEPFVDMLLAYTHRTASGIAVEDKKDFSHPFLMGSKVRTQAAALMAFLKLTELKDAPESLKSYPPLLLTELIEKQDSRARWQSTQDNIFAIMATMEYAFSYEKEKIDMRVSIDDKAGLKGSLNFKNIRDTAIRFTRKMQEDDPGKDQSLDIKKKGKGRLYYTMAVKFAEKERQEAVDNGLNVKLHLLSINDKPVKEGEKVEIFRGDKLEFACDISNSQEFNFIMAQIPLPAGLEVINTYFATSEKIDRNQKSSKDFLIASPWPFYHQEIRHKEVNFFAEYLSPGRWRLPFAAQAIATGEFKLPSAYAKALYRADIWGCEKDGNLTIKEKDK